LNLKRRDDGNIQMVSRGKLGRQNTNKADSAELLGYNNLMNMHGTREHSREMESNAVIAGMRRYT
jgi:hypothetical protein